MYTKDKVRALGMSAFNNRSEGENPEERACRRKEQVRRKSEKAAC